MAGSTENYQTFLSTFVENNEALFVIVIQIPFWFKTFVNSYLINQRDETQHFILLLNPFSEDAWQHGFESMFRFYWTLNEPANRGTKKLVNILSAIFGATVLLVILNSLYEWYVNS
ncbi:MAG: hypothetical protein GY816_24045 [Cytophagales bacterium]|nr:hypothetical protein [Cytophagales bacterium]